MNYYILGIITGLFISTINILLYTPKVQEISKQVYKKITHSNQATIIDPTDPLDNIEL